MSGIINRRVLVDTSKGRFDQMDYALVDTSLGTMVEVGTPGRVPFATSGDQLQRVDAVVPFNPDKIKSLFTEV